MQQHTLKMHKSACWKQNWSGGNLSRTTSTNYSQLWQAARLTECIVYSAHTEQCYNVQCTMYLPQLDMEVMIKVQN